MTITLPNRKRLLAVVMPQVCTFSYKNAFIFLQRVFNGLSGSVSLAWVGDGTGVSDLSMHLPCRAFQDVNSLAYIFLNVFCKLIHLFFGRSSWL